MTTVETEVNIQHAMCLAGLGLMGFIARRRTKDQA